MQPRPVTTSTSLTHSAKEHSQDGTRHHGFTDPPANLPLRVEISHAEVPGRNTRRRHRDSSISNEPIAGSGSSPTPGDRLKHDIPLLVLNADAVAQHSVPSYERSALDQLPNEIIFSILANLQPTDLNSVSLTSRHFFRLATTRQTWRSAFTNYFPTKHVPVTGSSETPFTASGHRSSHSFARLSAHASWRTEYTQRTRLLRALERGKPAQAEASPALAHSSRSATPNSPLPLLDYESRLHGLVTSIDANFDEETLGKHSFRAIHASEATGAVSSSDPRARKVDLVSIVMGLPQYVARFADNMYGLWPGERVGVPNPTDVSAKYGMIVGCGCPTAGQVKRCRMPNLYSVQVAELQDHGVERVLGQPRQDSATECVTSVWIAKTSALPNISKGYIGYLSGSSAGIVTTYSLEVSEGPDAREDFRPTAKWVLSPGVPIIAFAVDEQYSEARRDVGRVWAVALNALGEVFTMSKLPEPSAGEAWKSGRSVYWNLVDATRRRMRPDPYGDISESVRTIPPRSSWNGMGQSDEQIASETREIEQFMQMQPKHVQDMYVGFDMQRRLEVDFAGAVVGDFDDLAGESIVVIETGLAGEQGCSARVTRYTRCMQAASDVQQPDTRTETWRTTRLGLDGLRGTVITTSALDQSLYSTTTAAEDPLLRHIAGPDSSPTRGTTSVDDPPASIADIPGRRARPLAIGTKMGSVIIWDMRSDIPSSGQANRIAPLKTIFTDSPEITCLAVSALFIVHGGSDGLVQAWNPLGLDQTPVRTLNSRFSSRARRRLLQAEASIDGVGHNHYAAGAISIDPDPTVLRGLVSIGTQLRYWHFGSVMHDRSRAQKRRLRRLDRGSNSATDKGGPPDTHGDVRKFIANEHLSLRIDSERSEREAARMAGRYGTELLGDDASEEELVAYATMLSQEAHALEIESRQNTPVVAEPREMLTDKDEDDDVAEAIRRSLSLQEDMNLPGSSSAAAAPVSASVSTLSPEPADSFDEAADLDLALRLAMEEESLSSTSETMEGERFRLLRSPYGGKTKGKRRI